MAKGGGNIVPFDRGAAFIRERAAKQRSGNRLPEALALFRRALELEPDNEQYLMELAETLNGMGCIEESVRLLARLLALGAHSEECYFALGCNFYGLNNPDAARAALSHYLHIAPEGEYYDQALELIASLALAEQAQIADDRHARRARNLRARAVRLLNDGLYASACTLFARADAIRRPNAHESALRAHALMKVGDHARAMRHLRRVERKRAQPPALCLAARLWAEMGSVQAARRLILPLCSRNLEPEEKRLLLEAACAAGMHEEAAKLAVQLLASSPYDRDLLHIAAAALYNAGSRPEQATAYWLRMLSVVPDDPVALYYAREPLPPPPIPYRRQLPPQALDAMRASIREESASPRALAWALETRDEPSLRPAIEQLARAGDFESEMALRAFLLDQDAPAAHKLHALHALRARAVREPILLLSRNGLALLGRQPARPSAIPDECFRILWRILEAAEQELSASWHPLVETWIRVVTMRAHAGRSLRLTNDMAAAITRVALRDSLNRAQAAARFAVSIRSLRHLERKVLRLLRLSGLPAQEMAKG